MFASQTSNASALAAIDNAVILTGVAFVDGIITGSLLMPAEVEELARRICVSDFYVRTLPFAQARQLGGDAASLAVAFCADLLSDLL